MCVIYAATSALPETAELERGARRNDDGAGLAWLGPAADQKNGLIVNYKKGLSTAKDIIDFIQDNKLQLPIVIHFRTVSVGGKSKELTHPFPITEEVELDLEGKTEAVLFHNGHIANWDDLILSAGLRSTEYFPNGQWSDTRALAWLTFLKGEGILPFVIKGSRVAVFDSRAKQPIGLYGNGWIPKAGYQQSISTDYTNVGGARVYQGGKYVDIDGVSDDAWKNWRDGSYDGCEDPEVLDDSKTDAVTPILTKKEKKREAAGLLLNRTPEVNENDLDVWTLTQLNAILADMEKEQADAKLATGI